MTFKSWRMIFPAQAFAPGSGFLLRGSQLSRANSSAHAELSSIDMLLWPTSWWSDAEKGCCFSCSAK